MVLEICNRSENWRTASCLSPLLGGSALPLARRLGEPRETKPVDVTLELFWHGVRDHRHATDTRKCDEQLVEAYGRLFPDLRQRVADYGEFPAAGEGSYEVETNAQAKKLVRNVVNTEVDIVLESPGFLYIGEAKWESGFGRDGGYVLVHQLVRQYVAARLLVDVIGAGKKVVPFVVVAPGKREAGLGGRPAERYRPRGQIGFMVAQGWMEASNRLTWDTLAGLDPPRRMHGRGW